MRIYFVGSLDETYPDYAIIQNNLKSLITKFAEAKVGFVVRAIKQKPGIRIPIDFVILDALSEYNANHTNCPADVLLIVEPGVSFVNSIIPHRIHSASSSIRTEFYREILENTNLVLVDG